MPFQGIGYLKDGNERQQLAYQELMALNIMQDLADFEPILVGTIPIDIDLPNSDLDVICSCNCHKRFTHYVKGLYQTKNNFAIESKWINGQWSTIANFRGTHFEIEIFAQTALTTEQDAYRHLLIENDLLQLHGASFKQQIRALKGKGIKTEPAFATLLGLAGNPYQALLTLEEGGNHKK